MPSMHGFLGVNAPDQTDQANEATRKCMSVIKRGEKARRETPGQAARAGERPRRYGPKGACDLFQVEPQSIRQKLAARLPPIG